MQYKTGDVVKKKDESTLMTVESVKGDWVTCVWFPKDEHGEYTSGLQTAVIPGYTLEFVR